MGAAKMSGRICSAGYLTGPTKRASEPGTLRRRATQSRRDEGRLRVVRTSLRNAPSSALTVRSSHCWRHHTFTKGRYSTALRYTIYG